MLIFTMAKTSLWTSYFAVRIAKQCNDTEKYTAGVRFDRRNLIFETGIVKIRLFDTQSITKVARQCKKYNDKQE